MTEEQLKEIEARANAATRGPWVTSSRRDGTYFVCAQDKPGEMGTTTLFQSFSVRVDNVVNDARFVAKSRQDVPALVAEVRRLRKALKYVTDCFLAAEAEGLDYRLSCSGANYEPASLAGIVLRRLLPANECARQALEGGE